MSPLRPPLLLRHPACFLFSLRRPLRRLSTIPPTVSTSTPPFRQTLLALASLLAWYPVLDFFLSNTYQIMTVTGPSMYPFLNTDYNTSSVVDRVVINMWKPGDGLKKGMVVAFWSPLHPERMAVKRVVALEGDTVATKAPYPFVRETVPIGHVWVEGEHPENSRKSYDSNSYGPVSGSLLVGKVEGVVWPWRRAGRIRWEDYRGSNRVIEGKGVEKVEIFSL